MINIILKIIKISFNNFSKIYNLINNLDDISENKNWFEKFNPIKIFREEEENNSNNTSIQSIE